jgi:hypothetical protein
VDNLCKFLLDCLNGVLYNDDGQVIRLVAEKSFGNDRGQKWVHNCFYIGLLGIDNICNNNVLAR